MTTSDASSGEPRPTSDPIPNGEPPPSNPPPSSPPPPSEPSTVYEPVASTAPAPLAPRIEPSVGAAYSYAWSLLFKDFVPLLIIGIVAWAVLILVYGLLLRINQGLAGLYELAVAAPIAYGAAFCYLRAVRGSRPEVNDLFSVFRRAWLNAVIANLVVTVIVSIGFVLLIIPGIFLAVRLCFVPYIVADEGAGPFQALSESWNRTSGHFWTLFGAGLLAIVCVIIGFILLVIGSIPALMLVYLAFAALYDSITARSAGITTATTATA